MALISRVARLFRADFHAVLDRVEEPDILLRQAVREMEDDLTRDQQRYRRLEQDREQMGSTEEDLQQRCTSLVEELDICFAAGKEALARTLIRRKLETERSLQLLARRQDALAVQRDQLARRLEENRSRYEGMRQKSKLYDEQNRDNAWQDSWQGIDVRVSEEDVEVALLRERQRRATR